MNWAFILIIAVLMPFDTGSSCLCTRVPRVYQEGYPGPKIDAKNIPSGRRPSLSSCRETFRGCSGRDLEALVADHTRLLATVCNCAWMVTLFGELVSPLRSSRPRHVLYMQRASFQKPQGLVLGWVACIPSLSGCLCHACPPVRGRGEGAATPGVALATRV
ncbi:hypothetical protein QBC41DRAFT_328422 [Cercophora samala]|uniref:Secreted protein n=1 Tax=Cercophora samala TaxID=330535 RepID=A0AA39Z5I6_9PEZI|nr:hypothetical protein QBC41DRAFT_328422 [Cercophora samala]